nr:RNA-directed DNA polymerase, eukaryota [Tanacetum cinerariifolium]
MDQSRWIYKIDRNSEEYLTRLSEFIRVAEDDREKKGKLRISCLCKDCNHIRTYIDSNEIKGHLISTGFVERYTYWSWHGELLPEYDTVDSDDSEDDDDDSYDSGHDNLDDVLYDLEGDIYEDNQAKFQELHQRPPLNKAQHVKGANVGQKSFGVSSNSKVFSVSQSSYAGAVKNDGEHKQGKVADFGLLTNLKTVLTKEGFERFNLKYFGGFWVLIEFCTKELLEKFKSYVGVGSWFSSLEYASNSFVIDERAVWVDIEGVPMKIWMNNTFKKFASKCEMVPDTIFSPIQEEPKHANKSNFEEGEIQSEDPFHIYDLLVKKPKNDNKEEESSKATLKRSVGPQTGGSILQVMEDLVKIANAKKYLVISVYAPQEASEKRMLWSYLNHMIDRFIVDTWSNMSISDTNAISNFMKKLRHLKLQTRLWVRDKKESATMKKAQLKGMLNDIDILIDEKKVDQELLNKMMNVINSIHDLEKLEATEIAQKAKIKWSIEGDENTKFFHGILNKKRNQHAIRGILSKGNWIEDPNSVKNEFFSHFKEWFDSPCSSRLMLEWEFPNKLSADQSIDLVSNVTIEEIKRAVWDCGNFPKCGNSSFIALIPKMQDPKAVKDYRPISLIGIGGSMSRIKALDEIEAKLHSRLSKWKMKTLSSGGVLSVLVTASIDRIASLLQSPLNCKSWSSVVLSVLVTASIDCIASLLQR